MKKLFKPVFFTVSFLAANLFAVSGYYSLKLPDSFYIQKESSLSLSTAFPIDVSGEKAVASFAGETAPVLETVDLKLFGIIPIKSVEIHKVETPMLVPGGNPFGIKLLTEGVMVVGMSGVETSFGTTCPAQECGIEEGDVIISLDGREVFSNKDISDILEAGGGNPVEIIYTRDDAKIISYLTPVYSLKDCCYKGGMWVRDSTAGIGTVTFYEEETGRFGGLGHPVCDSDTGQIVPISSGEAVPVEITGVNKGEPGAPGELRGCFTSGRTSGVIMSNNIYGLFGELFSGIYETQALPMALKQEVEKGEAFIYTTIEGDVPQAYSIEIEEIDYSGTGTKNMVIEVTDKELIEKTGGIVQGMSGSPIIQNGKLAGAVTHVFVSDPKKGYGIFVENMYESGICG